MDTQNIILESNKREISGMKDTIKALSDNIQNLKDTLNEKEILIENMSNQI